MTLVEVMVALAILGFVLSAILTARARYLHQYVAAKTKLQGVQIADGLLAQWFQMPDGITVPANGTVTDHEDWQWQTAVVNDHLDDLDGFEIIRLTLTRTKEAATEPPMTVDLLFNPKKVPTTAPSNVGQPR